VVDISAIAGLASSFRSIVEITKAMKDVNDANVIQTKVFELTQEIMSAQACALAAQVAQSDLLQRERQLEEEISKLKDWRTEKTRYQLQRLPPGTFVYVLKAGMEGDDPPHRVCATCYQHHKISILQEPEDGYAECHDCGSKLHWSTRKGSCTSDYDPFSDQ
jgi:hypothetical protein